MPILVVSVAELRPPSRTATAKVASIAVPVALVALGIMMVLGARLAENHGDIASLPCFGSQFAAVTHPPAGAGLCGPQGYDGQFFFLQAHDPLLVHDATVSAMRGAGQLFRIQRLGYPLFAAALAGGRAAAIPAALLVLNVIVLLALTAWLAAWLIRRDRSPLWAVAVGLMPGMLLPVLRDLSDPLATASVLIGVLAWQERRRRTACVALSIAVLTREVTIAVVIALAAETLLCAWRAHKGGWRRVFAQAAPALGIPLVVFAAWQAYVMMRVGGAVGTAQATLPFVNVVQEAASTLSDEAPGVAGWELVYLALVVTAVGLAIRSLWRQVDAISVAACAVCASVVLPVFGDYWSDTRLSAPLLALVLLDGLRRRDRLSVAVPTIAAVMTLFILPAI
jgi:hypothetical protein